MSGRTRLRLYWTKIKLDLAVIWRLVKLSLPASIMGMERNLGGLVMMSFMAPFGTLAIAGHTVNQRIEFFLFMPAMALGQGAGVLAGQNLGAGQPERARRTGWFGMGVLSGIMVVLSVVVFIYAEVLVGIFNKEPGLVDIASQFLRIQVVSFLLMGPGGVLQSCISGAGDTMMPMIVALLNMWVIQVPLAYFLTHFTGLGVLGVRWAMVGSTLTSAIIYLIYFRMDRWERKQV